MKISNSKHQLAQLLIEAGVTQFPYGANWAAQGGGKGLVGFCKNKQTRNGVDWTTNSDSLISTVKVAGRIPNWHQTVLSRDEFNQIVASEKLPKHANCRCALRPIPEPTVTPTLDQLLHDWRNADDYAQRKQTEADEAAAMRDERWQAVQARAGEMGVTVGRREKVVDESGREWQIHDRCVVDVSPDDGEWEGCECTLVSTDSCDEYTPYCVQDDDGSVCWVHSIRRP